LPSGACCCQRAPRSTPGAHHVIDTSGHTVDQVVDAVAHVTEDVLGAA
jgi:hypothetical protein